MVSGRTARRRRSAGLVSAACWRSAASSGRGTRARPRGGDRRWARSASRRKRPPSVATCQSRSARSGQRPTRRGARRGRCPLRDAVTARRDRIAMTGMSMARASVMPRRSRDPAARRNRSARALRASRESPSAHHNGSSPHRSESAEHSPDYGQGLPRRRCRARWKRPDRLPVALT